MIRFFITAALSLILTSSAYALTLRIHCPYPNANNFYKKQYVYVDTVVKESSNLKPIKGKFKLTSTDGVIRLSNKYAKKNLFVRVSVSAPSFPPKKTAIPGCTTKPKQLHPGRNHIKFIGSGLTEDCGIVNVKHICK